MDRLVTDSLTQRVEHDRRSRRYSPTASPKNAPASLLLSQISTDSNGDRLTLHSSDILGFELTNNWVLSRPGGFIESHGVSFRSLDIVPDSRDNAETFVINTHSLKIIRQVFSRTISYRFSTLYSV